MGIVAPSATPAPIVGRLSQEITKALAQPAMRENQFRLIMTNRHKPLSIAIIGAGIGGLATAALLTRRGMTVRVYEQAPAFARVGAGIQMAPNAVKVLRALGVEDFLRRTAFRSDRALSRVWDSGEKWALF